MTLAITYLGQAVLTPDILARANRGARLLREIRDDLLAKAGPQRILAFPDIDPIRAPFGMFKVEWDLEERDFFDEIARGPVITAIHAVNPQRTAIENREHLRAQNAFPELNPPFMKIDPFVEQINNLLAIFEKDVRGREPAPRARLGLIVGATVLGMIILGTVVYLMRR